MWDNYREQPETLNYITKNKYIHARWSFSLSGIFAYIAPHCRSPPPPFRFQQTQNRKDGTAMKKKNLKDYYDHIVIDTYIDVPDEIFNIFEKHRKAEQAHRSKVYYNKAYYSLDHGDGIEHNAVFVSLTPDEIYERKLTNEQLHAAIATLPDKQAKRIYAYFFLGMSKTAIAKAEKINKSQVTRSINRGLVQIEKFLKNIF